MCDDIGNPKDWTMGKVFPVSEFAERAKTAFQATTCEWKSCQQQSCTWDLRLTFEGGGLTEIELKRRFNELVNQLSDKNGDHWRLDIIVAVVANNGQLANVQFKVKDC